MVIPEDVKRTVKPPADSDVGARWWQRLIRSQELDEGVIEGNGGIVVDRARSFKAEDIVEIKADS
jgi:hypothetical protein